MKHTSEKSWQREDSYDDVVPIDEQTDTNTLTSSCTRKQWLDIILFCICCVFFGFVIYVVAQL